jgi:hypothetical protein
MVSPLRSVLPSVFHVPDTVPSISNAAPIHSSRDMARGKWGGTATRPVCTALASARMVLLSRQSKLKLSRSRSSRVHCRPLQSAKVARATSACPLAVGGSLNSSVRLYHTAA